MLYVLQYYIIVRGGGESRGLCKVAAAAAAARFVPVRGGYGW